MYSSYYAQTASSHETLTALILFGFMYIVCNAIIFGVIAAQITIWFRRGFGWVVFVTLFPFALLWLLASGKRVGENGFKRCRMCRELVQWEAELCPHCRTDQYPERRIKPKSKSMTEDVSTVQDKVVITGICPNCKSINTTDSTHCFQCGKEL